MNNELDKFPEAFELWEQCFHTDPTKFLTYEETAFTNVGEMSAECAAYFYQLLEEINRIKPVGEYIAQPGSIL